MSGRLDALVKSMIFPRPKPATFSVSTHPDTLLYIPCVNPATLEETGQYTNGYLFREPSSTHMLLYAHPNAVDIGMMYNELRHLSKHANIDVLAFEYSGYGLSHSEITEASVHGDMMSAYQFTRRYLATPPGRIVICGRSIGAAPAARLCATLPVAETPSLLILQCPFTALSECIQEFSHNAVSIANFLGYNWFRTIDVIADVRCPVVLHHGTHDSIVPISHSYALRERRDRAARPCVTYFYQEDGKGHNNLSRSLLIRVVGEKVESEGLSPLRTAWPACLVAHVPIQPLLFPTGCDKVPLRATHDHWQRSLHLGHFLFTRESLYVLLTASVCSFAMRVAHAWQVYSEIVKQNARNTSATRGEGRALSSGDGRSGDLGGRMGRGSGSGAPGQGDEEGRDRRRGSSVCGEDRRCSKEAFIARCLACWGSPLGVHVPAAGLSLTADALIFGSYVPPGKWADFDLGCRFSTRPPGPLATVAELPITPGLLRAMQRIVSSAPDLLHVRGDSRDERRQRPSMPPAAASSGSLAQPTDSSSGSTPQRDEGSFGGCEASTSHLSGLRSATGVHVNREDAAESEKGAPVASTQSVDAHLPAYVHPELVLAVQGECERIVGFMQEEEAERMRALFVDFEAGCQARLSAKARTSPGGSLDEETFDELREWLRPYQERPLAMASIAEEVPWDYYLLKARVLADRRRLELDMDWGACVETLHEAGVVASIYDLFRYFYLHRAPIPADA